MAIDIFHGDIIDNITKIPDNTYNAIITDPPYGLSEDPDVVAMLNDWLRGEEYEGVGLGFKDSEWDKFVPGPRVWTELYRTCRPGAIMMVYCGTRTSDLMGISVRMGGWRKFDELDVYGPHDQLSWLYSTGWPKNTNISKQADKRVGAEGEIISQREVVDIRNGHGREYGAALFAGEDNGKIIHTVRKPSSDTAIQWQGYGTGLTPSHEVIMLFRKPREGTFLDNAVEHGTGVLNIAAAQISSTGEQARWPKNTIMECCNGELDSCNCPIKELDKQAPHSSSKKSQRGAGINGPTFQSPQYASTERGYNDSGSAARFFYVAKPSNREKFAGLSEECRHPTMKPVTLAKKLAEIVIPPIEYRDKATICVPFSGSGSESIGAILAGWKNVHMFERDPEFIEMSLERLAWWQDASESLSSTDVKYILDNRKD